MHKKSAQFITIEGVEGAGKSTAMQFIEKYLQKQGIDFVLTREPGGTEIAEVIRKVILAHYMEKMCPYTELLLYFAGRAQHVNQVIRPALQQGKWVISDRFTDASYAYQGIGRGIPDDHIATLETWIQGDLRPDLVFIMDIDAKEGIARTKSIRELDRIELESLDFFQRIRAYYLQKAQQNPAKYKLIDGMQSKDKVEQQIIDILSHV